MPGHSNIPSNDLADRAAKEATTIESNTIHPTPLSCVFQVINELFCDDPPSHARTSKIYQHCKTLNDLQQIKSCRDDVLITRLRSGYHLSLKAHHHRIDPEIDHTCHHVSKQNTHYNTGFLNAQQEMLFVNVCLGITKGH